MRIRFTKQRILHLTIAFCVFTCFIVVYFSRNPKLFRTTNTMKYIEFNPCHYLNEDVTISSTNEYRLTVSFTQQIPEKTLKKINCFFGYQTQSFGLPLLLRPGSLKTVSTSQRSVTFDLPLPFIQNYSGYLVCITPEKYKPDPFQIPRNILAEVDNYVDLDIKIKNFRRESENEFSRNWSQMKCYGNSFETRYCEMRYVTIYHNIFVFATLADYIFPEPFLSAGARSAPFDRVEGRLIYEPTVIHSPIDSIVENGNPTFQHFQTLCYVIARFYNSMMLWHTVFDFLVPAFNTFQKIEKGNFSDNRRVFLRDHDINAYPELLQSMSRHEIVDLYSSSDNITRKFDRVIVGLEKLEKNPSAARGMDDMLNIQYDFRNDTAPMLRDAVLKTLKISPPKINPEEPLILIVERAGSQSRVIINIEEIEEYILTRCDFCKIKRVSFSSNNLLKQIQLTAGASVLFGAHGSGLSNCLWMKPSTEDAPTALIEVFPHGYNCRNWFNGAANVSRIDYYSVMSGKKGANLSLSTEYRDLIQMCWNNLNLCKTLVCHDPLRDQNISLEIGALSSVFMPIVNKMKKARKIALKQ